MTVKEAIEELKQYPEDLPVMTVKELIEELQRYPENLPVFVDGEEPLVRYNDEYPLGDDEYCCAIEVT